MRMLLRAWPLVLLVLALVTAAVARSIEPAQVHRGDHVVVRYTGVDAPHARAIAAVVEAARAAAVARGFDVPPTLEVTADLGPNLTTRLFNDGQDRLTLTLKRPDQLASPARSGVNLIYGLCHELAHLAMYRPIRNHSWLTGDAAEGWAHYLGSELVDEVFAAAGDKVWPEPHDYRDHGTRRLAAQLKSADPSATAEAAGLWQELAALLGRESLPKLFRAWGSAEVDPRDPAAALRTALLAVKDDEQVRDWWNRAEPRLIHRQPASGFAARTVHRDALARKPVELSHDDGMAAGKRSMAGSGHIVAFDAPGAGFYLTEVKVHGGRYGSPQPPAEPVEVWLLDADGGVVRTFEFPYGRFARGNPRWVALPIEPTEVPPRFSICIGFNPTATRGVFVSHDGDASGHSSLGLPGRGGAKLERGDWLIRVSLDQPAAADALR